MPFCLLFLSLLPFVVSVVTLESLHTASDPPYLSPLPANCISFIQQAQPPTMTKVCKDQRQVAGHTSFENEQEVINKF